MYKNRREQHLYLLYQTTGWQVSLLSVLNNIKRCKESDWAELLTSNKCLSFSPSILYLKFFFLQAHHTVWRKLRKRAEKLVKQCDFDWTSTFRLFHSAHIVVIRTGGVTTVSFSALQVETPSSAASKPVTTPASSKTTPSSSQHWPPAFNHIQYIPNTVSFLFPIVQ